MPLSTKKGVRGSVSLAYQNGLTNTLIIAMLLCSKLYVGRSNINKIVMYPNNFLKTQMLSHVRHYVEAPFFTLMKHGDMCGANV